MTAWAEDQLAGVLVENGGRDEAVVLVKAGLVTLEQRLPEGHSRVVRAQEVVGRLGR